MAAVLRTSDLGAVVLVEHTTVDLDLKAVAFGADVALLDVTAHESRSAARLLRALNPDISTVAVAVVEVAEEVIACAESGFDAYIPRTAQTAEMLEIIRRVEQGETVCHPRIARNLFNELASRRAPAEPCLPDQHLTPREIEIARLIGHGAANKQIAAELHLSVATIKNHVHSVLRKLQVENRSQVASLLIHDPMMLGFR
ncbi:response regulator transcription factor [Geodermatophilus sp. SYSU D00766]